MPKISICLTIVSFILRFAWAQNLIRNGSFEHFAEGDYPEARAMLIGGGPAPTDWVYINTVDNYLSLEKDFWCCKPSNPAAEDGRVYIGFICYGKENPNYREYALGLINKPLIKGHRYYVSFYLQYSYNSPLLINEFHCFFLNDKIHFPNNIRNGFPDTVKVITIPMNKKYSQNWTLINDTFIANGDEAEIGFGNLISNDKDVKYEELNHEKIKKDIHSFSNNSFAYVFLDNVSLIALDTENMNNERKNSENSGIIKINTIRFLFNDTNILFEYSDTLKFLIDTLEQTQLKVKLTGYTDSIGNYNYNLLLSQKRANAIKNVLIKNGISTDRIKVDYKSYLNPLKSNETESERSMNRRVEIILLKSNP